jgi:hypothetical protein
MSEIKIGKYLQFYIDCMERNERLPDYGLCNALGGTLLELFEPTASDEKELIKEGLSALYWASGYPTDSKYDLQRWHSFTPLRQTIVLFMAAINNEL